MRSTLILLTGALAVIVLGVPKAGAGSIQSVYDMNRMLSEPHPLAHQYGTRWNPAPVGPAPAAPQVPPPQARPYTAPQPAPAPAYRAQPQAQPRPAPRVTPASAPARTQPAAMSSGGGNFIHEIKIGALAHDLGPFSSQKEDGVDAQVELRFASPDFLKYIWSPYPHIGANINSSGDTSSAWIGVVWEKQVWKNFFAGWTMGGAYHNGKTDKGSGAEDEKELGCSVLFRLAINVGWRFDEHHSIDAILDHISNAKICDTNEGLENVGIRYGYRF